MNQQNNENEYQESISIVLDLESLSAQYKNYLIEYQQAVANYVNYLKQNNTGGSLSSVRGSSYWGTSSVGENVSKTLQQCEASCSNTVGCTGATFNPPNHGKVNCFLRGGDSNLSTGSNNGYAIVPTATLLLLIVKKLNQQLTDVNSQIQQKTTAGQPLYDAQSEQRGVKTFELIGQFIQLNQEREKINQELNEFQTLDQAQSQGDLMINQNYYSFLLLLGLVIVIIIVLYKFGFSSTTENATPLLQSGGELGINAYYIVFGIVIVAFLLHFIKNKYLV
jgi:hypothetical protein